MMNSDSAITLSASDLRRWERCRREYVLRRTWKVVRRVPKELFDSCLREGVLALSNSTAAAEVVTTARERFLREAANPGLDLPLGADSWQVAQDWAGMLGVVLTSLSRANLPTLHRAKLSDCLSMVSWLPSSFLSPDGTLHRWLTCDRWSLDELARQGHSWHTLGDMAVLDAPMTLHVVEIGRQRDGRRHSPWQRAFKHPCIAGMMRFQRPDSKGVWRKLKGEKWVPVWYADITRPDPETWCDLMDQDHVTPALLRSQSIARLEPRQASRIRAEILAAAREIGRLLQELPDGAEQAMEVPPTRSACDPVTGPCAWQALCYSDHASPAELALYQIRAAGASARSSTGTPGIESPTTDGVTAVTVDIGA